MGTTHVTAQIRNLSKKGKGYEAEFLVDTGAIDCMAPRDRLLKAGVKPERKKVYELANGEFGRGVNDVACARANRWFRWRAKRSQSRLDRLDLVLGCGTFVVHLFRKCRASW